MNGINKKHIFLAVFVTLAAVSCLYLLVMWSEGELIGNDSSSLKVSASDNVDYIDENIVYTTSNQKAGLTFIYYYDKDTGEYGIKVKQDYKYFASEIDDTYGENGVFLVNCEKLKFIYMMIYNKESDTYSVEDIYKSDNQNSVIEVNKDYNGVHINCISYSDVIGWNASVAKGKKLAIQDKYVYHEYIASTFCSDVKIKAKFNDETRKFDFSITQGTINSLPKAASKDTKYSIVVFQLDSLNANLIAKYDEDSQMWSLKQIGDIPYCTETNKEYNKDEVLFVEDFNIYVNTVEGMFDGVKQKKYQFFSKDGEFLFDCVCGKLPTITEQ